METPLRLPNTHLACKKKKYPPVLCVQGRLNGDSSGMEGVLRGRLGVSVAQAVPPVQQGVYGELS